MPAYQVGNVNSRQGTVYSRAASKEWFQDFEITLDVSSDKALEAAKLKGWCYYQHLADDGNTWTFIKDGFNLNVLVWCNNDGSEIWNDCPIVDYWQSSTKNTKSADYFQEQFAIWCKSCF